ncbi:MAG: phytanoyl-CoA dioxygenase family protein [Acidimicrobiales bacterium]|jgi:non-heme Fe2+,alpha-ketoglutarate-dependent halogenase
MGQALSDEQIRHYRDLGYVFPVPALSTAETAAARAQLEAHESRSGHPLGPSERSKCHLLFKWVDDIMRNKQLVDAVEDLIGPDILCWNTIFWIKEARTPTYVGWHQDLKYWGLDNDELVSVWVALSPATEASGCMSVLPGSHLELLDHDETYHGDNMLTRGQELKIDVGGRDPVAMPLKPGQASFHNVKSAHGSGPNDTDDRRIGLSMHYMPTHTRQTVTDWDSAALVRGADSYHHFEHCPQPRYDLDPVAVEFHQRAGKALREIVYAGADQTDPTL